MVDHILSTGHVVDILSTGGEEVGLVGVEPFCGSSGSMVFFRRSFKKVRLSEKIRRPIAHGVSKVFNSQSLIGRIMTLWRIELLGMGGGLPGGAWDIELGCRLDQEGIG